MSLITNIGIQIFTYDRCETALSLLDSLGEILEEPLKQRFVWIDLDDSRRSAQLGRILGKPDGIKFNAGYVQSARLDGKLKAWNFGENVIVHFQVSPDSILWLQSSGVSKSGRPVKSLIVRNLKNVEKCAAYHKPEIIPTVLEVTLTSSPVEPAKISGLLEELLEKMCSRISGLDYYATADMGDGWLFFPHGGINPNNSTVEIYHASLGRQLIRAGWSVWRVNHNISLVGFADDRNLAQPIVHSLEPRRSLSESLGQ